MTVEAPSSQLVRSVHEAEEWNGLVQSFPAYDLRQGFEWGELRRTLGWRPFRFAAGTHGRPGAACSILCRSIPGVGAVLYAPRGPLFDPADPGALAALVARIRQLARQTRAIVLRISPGLNTADTEAGRCLASCGFVPIADEFTGWNSLLHTQLVHLEASEEELWRHVRRRFREYVAAAGRKGLVIESSHGEAEVAAFHRLMANAARLKRFPIRDLDYYRSLVQHYRKTGHLIMLVARAEGAVVGGLLGARLGERAFMLHTSVRGDGTSSAQHHVAPAIYWEFIRQAKAAGCVAADFGGAGVHLTPREGDKGYGLYRFKAGFGCRLETFLPLHDLVCRPALYRAFRAFEGPLVSRLWRLAVHKPAWLDWRWPCADLVRGATDVEATRAAAAESR
jgi:lipid II:glycine glycyltransferase (peptidoglycan interpeptide bridge formation enzyme)